MLGRKLLRILWFIVALSFFLLIVGGWVKVNGGLLLHGSLAEKVGALGNLFGFFALYIFVVLTIMGTRFFILERAFGLDRLIRIHKKIAPLAIILVFVHVICRVFVFAKSKGMSWDWDFAFQFFPYSWDITENALVFARWAVLALVFASVIAQAGRVFVPFRMWKPTHSLLYCAAAIGFAHSIIVGHDVRFFPLVLVWFILFLPWLGLVSYRLRYLMARASNHVWVLEGVDYETHDTHTCRFFRRGDEDFLKKWSPGQFALFRMKSKLWGWTEPHPFTLSCVPEPEKICCTVKGVGNFSKKLRTAKPGTRFLCEGPYGIFTPDFEREKNLIFIAGGIGITPFLSIIRYIFKNNLDVDVTLIWGNKAKKDIVAYSELSRYAKSSDRLKVVHVLSEQKITEKLLEETSKDGFLWEQGYVSGQLLKKYINPEGATYYLCGPPPMQRFILSELRDAFGVSSRKVRRELFILY